MASSMLPLASVSAALHSIMPGAGLVAKLLDLFCRDCHVLVLRRFKSAPDGALLPYTKSAGQMRRRLEYLRASALTRRRGVGFGAALRADCTRSDARRHRRPRPPRRAPRPPRPGATRAGRGRSIRRRPPSTRTGGWTAARRRCRGSRSPPRRDRQLVSTMPMTGIFSLRASSTAIFSLPVSTMKTASGSRDMWRMPSRFFSSLRFSFSVAGDLLLRQRFVAAVGDHRLEVAQPRRGCAGWS